MEQVKLLKTEVRRLESNQQRETAISNLEYLKNIIYKVLPTLQSTVHYTPSLLTEWLLITNVSQQLFSLLVKTGASVPYFF